MTMNLIYDPWPWYVAGPLIALTMFVLLYIGKQFGMSSNLRTMCSIGGAAKYSDFFKFDWKAQRWNLIVVLGAVIGGFIASQFMSNNTVKINPEVAQQLSTDYGIESAGEAYLPTELFASENLTDSLTEIARHRPSPVTVFAAHDHQIFAAKHRRYSFALG